MNPKLDGYTFYAHNLGRFDAIFIIKSLVTNKNIKLSPVWKDNSIVSLVINLNKKNYLTRLFTVNLGKFRKHFKVLRLR